AQQVSDAKDEKGLAYCTGYTAGLIAQMVLLKRVKGGTGAEVVEKGPYSGEEWYNYLKKAYGEDNVDWASGKYKANDISTEFDYYVSQRYIDSHIELYEKYFGLKDSGLSHKEINNKLLDNYLDSRISDSGGWFTDKNANEVKSAMEQAYNNSNNIDTTISKELFYDIKNELIPYEPEKQFPNAYKIYKEKFFNSNSLGAIINNGIRKKIEFEWNAWGREGLNGKKSALYVLNYDDAKAISETCLNSKEIAIKLGLAEDTYSDGVWLGKIDPTAVENIRISTANELGANEWWVPGLRTSGGQYETVISRIENIDEAIDKKIVYFEKIKK
ncbi:hypothetical protein, partial [Clostridium sp. HBUAS56017]|uniref:hypothetical protein n=1 Tax=Clostridium sp. HBUAS56017 TaxID=2571128 RepID=UPI00163D58ED